MLKIKITLISYSLLFSYVKNQNMPSLLFSLILSYFVLCILWHLKFYHCKLRDVIPLHKGVLLLSVLKSVTSVREPNKLAACVMLLGRLLSIVRLLHSIQSLLHSSAALCTGDATSFPRARHLCPLLHLLSNSARILYLPSFVFLLSCRL